MILIFWNEIIDVVIYYVFIIRNKEMSIKEEI